MQIRPASSLLQAIAKSAEPKPVPFAQRLADLAAKTPVASAQADRAARNPVAAAPQAPRPDMTGPVKPRGSVIDVIV